MLVAAKLGSLKTLDLLYSLGEDPGQPVDEDGLTTLFALISEYPPRLRPACLNLMMLGWGAVNFDAMCDQLGVPRWARTCMIRVRQGVRVGVWDARIPAILVLNVAPISSV